MQETYSANLGWVVGAAFIVVVWVMYVTMLRTPQGGRDWFMTKLWEGADGRASFSKFQFWLWTWVVVLAIFSIWVARTLISPGIVSPIDEIPETVLSLLGLSVVTSIGAKVVTTNYVNRGITRKPAKKEGDRATVFQELLSDDSGYPELAKLQMFLFTWIAIIFFLISVAKAINSGDAANMALPDLDQMWLVLMGVSSGGYLGKKLVTQERPVLTGIMPSQIQADTRATILIMGRALGSRNEGVLAVGPRVFKTDDQKDAANINWTNSVISVDLQPNDLAPNQNYQVEVTVGDSKSDPLMLRVV